MKEIGEPFVALGLRLESPTPLTLTTMSVVPTVDFEVLNRTVFEVTGELPIGINFIRSR